MPLCNRYNVLPSDLTVDKCRLFHWWLSIDNINLIFCLGARCGSSMLEKLRSKIPVWLDDCGEAVAVQEDPFVVAIVTPIMSRAHSTAFAGDICFVDSTASCDADNHVITFMLTPTSAGAVPLGLG